MNLLPGSLPSVEYVRLDPGSGDPDQDDELTVPQFDMGVFQELFDAAPNVKTLVASYCFGCLARLELGNLEVLEFSQSFLCVPDLENIFAKCGRLHIFRYWAWEGNLSYVLNECFNPEDDVEASDAEFHGVFARLLPSLRTINLAVNLSQEDKEVIRG